ncbi:hypothetical protein CerSpe_249460 [Prunus speciosa]
MKTGTQHTQLRHVASLIRGIRVSLSFADYKELLSADVLEIAFQSQNDQKLTGFGGGDVNSYGAEAGDVDQDGSSKGGGKKKGKKGKKVSPAVLGFNVVSNRIMMGEIQTVKGKKGKKVTALGFDEKSLDSFRKKTETSNTFDWDYPHRFIWPTLHTPSSIH